MTDAQLEKASGLRDRDGFANVEYRKSYIEELPIEDASVDAVISNGVINLSPDKPAVFREIARILKPGGRLAIADIVTQSQLPETVSCNADLWAACIGGAMQVDEYCAAIEAAGLAVTTTQVNDQYGFVSDSAMGATDKWGVQSISLLAVKKG
jgi:ubiquinone/menaquinone biosynthesis C-methylase UbiE